MPKPNTLGKNLHLCFSSVIKCSQPHHVPHHPTSPTSPPQLLQNYHHCPSPTTTLYNSLYEDSSTSNTTAVTTAASNDTNEEEATVRPTTPDLAAIYASRRFFISSPGTSNSIVDSSSSSSSSSSLVQEEVAGGVPVQTYSPNPYVDFRRSMEEMVEAHDRLVGQEAWDYLQELLLSYLSLNPKSTHKYIVGAFADLVASLLISPNHILNHSS